MGFSVFLAAPVHIEVLENRVRKYGAEIRLPTESELKESDSLNGYSGFLIHAAYGSLTDGAPL